MRSLLVFCVLCLLTTSLQAQEGELSPLDITAVRITRSEDDVLTLEVEGTAAVCGEVIISEWSAHVYNEFIPDIPVGDQVRGTRYHEYFNFSVFVLPAENQTCDTQRVVTIPLPDDLPKKMPDVPNHVTDWDGVLLVNNFAAWFYLVGYTESSPGQPIDFGTTDLIRWQKVDSVIQDLYSIGADPGTLIPWLEGYHPDGCEARTLVNVIRDPIATDTYTFDVFRLLPMDTICPESTQPFVLAPFGVVPQGDVILNVGELSYAVKTLSGNFVTPVQRQYATITDAEIETTGEDYSVVVSVTQDCVTIAQAEMDGITFVSIYTDVPLLPDDLESEVEKWSNNGWDYSTAESPCTAEESAVEKTITVPALPVVINGAIILE